MKYASYIKSSLHDIRCCDETATTVTTGWRALASSVTCVQGSNDLNTGYATVATLEEYNLSTGLATGNTKPNSPSDPNYVPDYISSNCPIQTPPHNGGASGTTINCYAPCKGTVEIIGLHGTDVLVSYVPNSHNSVSIGSGAYQCTVTNHDVASSAPVPCVIVVNGIIAANADGTPTAVNANAPFTLDIRPAGYVPPAS